MTSPPSAVLSYSFVTMPKSKMSSVPPPPVSPPPVLFTTLAGPTTPAPTSCSPADVTYALRSSSPFGSSTVITGCIVSSGSVSVATYCTSSPTTTSSVGVATSDVSDTTKVNWGTAVRTAADSDSSVSTRPRFVCICPGYVSYSSAVTHVTSTASGAIELSTRATKTTVYVPSASLSSGRVQVTPVASPLTV